MRKIFSLILLVTILFNFSLNKALAEEYQFIREKLSIWVKGGVKQKDLAEALGVHPSTMSKFINGTIQHSPNILYNFKIRYPQEYEGLSIQELQKIPTKQAIKVYQSSPKTEIIISESTRRPSVIKERVKATLLIIQKTPIVISYRDEGGGKGAFYDHYTIQKATGFPTSISHAPNIELNAIKDYIKTITQNLPLGIEVDGRKVPQVISNSFEGGLLIIPGRTRNNEYEPIRTSYERTIIKEALKRGQPILSICAGAWQLWEAFGGTTRDVVNHCYRGGMMRIGVNGNIVCNKQIHRVSIEEDSLLSKAMGTGPHVQLKVNSLHWKAPDEKEIPQFLRVVAKSIMDNNIAPLSPTGNNQPMAVESNTIEAFESQYGAPILGIQWHPEAYNSNDTEDMCPMKYINVIKYMAQSGSAYQIKRRMLKELEEVIK